MANNRTWFRRRDSKLLYFELERYFPFDCKGVSIIFSRDKDENKRFICYGYLVMSTVTMKHLSTSG